MGLSIKNNLGTEVKKVAAFSFTESDMGEAFITLDTKFPAGTDPAFALTWYVTFKGENFYLSTLKPPATKDTSSIDYTYSLTFKSERENLKRYLVQDFAEMPVGNTALVPQSDDFSFYGDLTQFAARFNLNLEYWFGTGVWLMEVNPSYTPSTEQILVSCAKTTLWDLLREMWELFGVRWTIVSETGVMKIKVAYAAEEIEHIFEYGMADTVNNEKGLVEINRVNPLNAIYTRLSGKGSTKNVPAGYFKDGDPDENAALEFAYIPNILPTNYREYIKGWNTSAASGTRDAGHTDAWYAGYDDEAAENNINPIDYVESDNKDIYGLWCGSLEPNEDIFPTLQGATSLTLGELDEVVAVEAVTNDDYESAMEESSQEPDSIEDLPSETTVGAVNFGDVGAVTAVSRDFIVGYDDSEAAFAFSVGVNTIDQGWGSYEIDTSWGYTLGAVVGLHDASTDALIASKTFSAASGSGTFTGVAVGTYYLKLTVTIDNDVTVDEPDRTGGDVTVNYNVSAACSLGSIKIYEYPETEVGGYKQTFDIFVKNIWNSTKGAETDTEYVNRIWDPLVTTSDMTVMFSDGMLAGDDYEFKVAKINGVKQIFYDTSASFGGVSSEWRLTLIKSDAELEASNRQIPNISQNAVAGDHLFFINIDMPYDPYVYAAEDRVRAWIGAELAKVDGEYPTFLVRPSKIFMDIFSEVDKLRAGNTVRIRDVRLIGVSYIVQHISSLTLTYSDSSSLPEWELSITDQVNVDTNPISLLQGEVMALTSGALSSAQQIQEAVRAMSRTFLRKDGVSDTSYSSTTFNENVRVGKNIVSKDFIQGDFGGTGMGMYRDANGNTVLEVDKAVVRREMRVNELLINQVTFTGGKQVFSAAGVEVTAVEDISGAFRLYFDNKNGTRQNQFITGDQAYCQRFDPATNAVIKYYWSLVTAVGADYIEVSKTDSDGTGRPDAGDNVAQMGNRTDVARQSCLIIDQLNGGSLVQYAGISGYSLTNKNYVGFGVNPSTGKAYNYTYGETFIGDRDITDPDATYVTFQQKLGDTAPKVYIKADIVIGAGSSGLSNLSEWAAADAAIGTAQDTANSAGSAASVAQGTANTAQSTANTANANAIGAAIVNNPNLIRDGYRMKTGNIYPFDQQDNIVYLTAGKTYTFSVRGRKVSGTGNYLAVFLFESTWASVSQIAIPETSLITKKATFVPSITGNYHVGCYSSPSGNGGDCEVLWTMLQEGGVYVDQNTQFKQTAEEAVANLENLLEDSVSRTETAGVGLNYECIELASIDAVSGLSYQPVLTNGSLYTLSFGNVVLSTGTKYSIRIYNLTDSSWDGSPYINDAVPTGKTSHTFRIPNDGKNWGILLYIGVRGATGGKTITLSNIMLQYGPFSTPWRKSQDEIDADIAAAALTANWTGINEVPSYLGAVSAAGLYVSENFMGYYDGTEWKSYFDNNGNAVFVGVAEFGTELGEYSGNQLGIAIKGADIYEPSPADQGQLHINRIGYDGGITRNKDLIIWDGKGSWVAEFLGLSRTSMFYKLEANNPVLYGDAVFSNGSAVFNESVDFNESADFNESLDASDATNISLTNHYIVHGASSISCSSSETDMANMTINITPKGTKILIEFSASFYATSNANLFAIININSTNIRFMQQYLFAGQPFPMCMHFMHTVTPGTSYTVKIRWSGGTAIMQRGSLDGTRVLTVVDLM